VLQYVGVSVYNRSSGVAVGRLYVIDESAMKAFKAPTSA